jgi:hypothetical protein
MSRLKNRLDLTTASLPMQSSVSSWLPNCNLFSKARDSSRQGSWMQRYIYLLRQFEFSQHFMSHFASRQSATMTNHSCTKNVGVVGKRNDRSLKARKRRLRLAKATPNYMPLWIWETLESGGRVDWRVVNLETQYGMSHFASIVLTPSLKS